MVTTKSEIPQNCGHMGTTANSSEAIRARTRITGYRIDIDLNYFVDKVVDKVSSGRTVETIHPRINSRSPTERPWELTDRLPVCLHTSIT